MTRAAFRSGILRKWAPPSRKQTAALYGSRRTEMWGNPRLSQMTTPISFTNPSVSNNNIQGSEVGATLKQANRLRFTVRRGPDAGKPSSVSDDNADIVHKSFCLK